MTLGRGSWFRRAVEWWLWRQNAEVQTLVLALVGVTLSELLKFSNPQFPHLWNGNDNCTYVRYPLQCSCLENPRDGGAWWAAV